VRVRGGGRARENREGLAERTFCRVCPRFQQAINGHICDGPPAALINFNNINALGYDLDHKRSRLLRTASSRTRLAQSIFSPSSAATSLIS